MELFLKLNGEFLRQPNEMGEVFKKLDRKFSDKIENFYGASNIQNKKKILSDLVEYIYKKSRGPLPSKWFLKDYQGFLGRAGKKWKGLKGEGNFLPASRK